MFGLTGGGIKESEALDGAHRFPMLYFIPNPMYSRIPYYILYHCVVLVHLTSEYASRDETPWKTNVGVGDNSEWSRLVERFELLLYNEPRVW